MDGIDYQALEFPYRRHSPDSDNYHAIVIVGAGPVGLTTALDLAQRGCKVVVVDDDCRLSTGSRAICFAKRTLDIWDRLGVGQHMVDKGVSWNVGKVFFKDQEVWRFDLLPEQGHRRPAFINLQQYYCEGFLLEYAQCHPNIELRWKHKAVAVKVLPDGIELTLATPDGSYTLTADWLVACDGSRSPVRKMIGQESHGRVFRDRFLIADIKMQAEFPTERRFWFDPPFHPNQSVLLHRQPDNVWRVDFQLGWEADPIEEAKPEKVMPRLNALFGPDVKFELEWVSIYTFACERMDHFRHGRILFAGDAAHRVSPFGARGANSGVQDADNLAWKLHRVVHGLSPASLLDTYATEREQAADENVAHSTRSTDFITPKSEISLLFRNTVLKLARQFEFARKLVNSGRLSTATCYLGSALHTPDTDDFSGAPAIGSVAPDAPIYRDSVSGWWLDELDGSFVVAVFYTCQLPSAAVIRELVTLRRDLPDIKVILVLGTQPGPVPPAVVPAIVDCQSLLSRRYDAQDGTCYLIRPDQHIAARWRNCHPASILKAWQRAAGVLQTGEP